MIDMKTQSSFWSNVDIHYLFIFTTNEQVNRVNFDFMLASNYLAFRLESYSFKTSTELFVIMDFRVKLFGCRCMQKHAEYMTLKPYACHTLFLFSLPD